MQKLQRLKTKQKMYRFSPRTLKLKRGSATEVQSAQNACHTQNLIWFVDEKKSGMARFFIF